MNIIFIKFTGILLCIITLALDYFRKRDYKQKIPLLLNIIFYLFVIIPFGSHIFNFIQSICDLQYLDYIFLYDKIGLFATKCMYTYFCILIWYDNMESIATKNTYIYIYIIKLIIIIIIGIITGMINFTILFTSN